MTADQDCVRFLQWALPRIGLRWEGFRRVRRQVCRRIRARAKELGLADLVAYRTRVENDPGELARIDVFARVTISRFYRDRGVFERLRRELLPDLLEKARAAGRASVRALSVGCASGEEAYTLAIIWGVELVGRFPGVSFGVLGIDAGEDVLSRARRACYRPSSVKELPVEWRESAFEQCGPELCLTDELKSLVALRRGDVRSDLPPGPFDLVLCRNLVFTYFDTQSQRDMVKRLVERMHPDALLLVGAHETLPEGAPELELVDARARAYRRTPRLRH
jgi:chemotaxis protein methyltransferase CheR